MNYLFLACSKRQLCCAPLSMLPCWVSLGGCEGIFFLSFCCEMFLVWFKSYAIFLLLTCLQLAILLFFFPHAYCFLCQKSQVMAREIDFEIIFFTSLSLFFHWRGYVRFFFFCKWSLKKQQNWRVQRRLLMFLWDLHTPWSSVMRTQSLSSSYLTWLSFWHWKRPHYTKWFKPTKMGFAVPMSKLA